MNAMKYWTLQSKKKLLIYRLQWKKCSSEIMNKKDVDFLNINLILNFS